MVTAVFALEETPGKSGLATTNPRRQHMRAVQGQDRGEEHCTSDKYPTADEWNVEKQLVVRGVKANVAGECMKTNEGQD